MVAMQLATGALQIATEIYKAENLVHFAALTVLQNLRIPSTNSSLVRGLTSRRINSFSSCHIFSTGLRSGDSGGVFHQLIPFAS